MNETFCILIRILPKSVPEGPNGAIIGSGNGLVTYRPQAIT